MMNTSTTGIPSATAPTKPAAPASAAAGHDGVLEWLDPRDQIEVSVLMADGRLAPRHFSSREEAEAWAIEGEQVVEYNLVCACDR